MIGKVHPKGTMFLRHSVGTCKDEEGREYEMTAHVSDMSPIIHSETSGKYFTLSWTDIMNLAIKAGVDKKEEGK